MLLFLPVALLAGFAFFGETISDALDYLRRALLPSAPASGGVAPTYTPPFTGGQCVGSVYEISFTQTHPNPSYVFFASGTNTRTVNRTDIGNNLTGAITGFSTFVDGNGTTRLRVSNSTGTTLTLSDGGGAPNGIAYSYGGFTVTPRSGQPNNCGDLPNPDPPPAVPNDGISDTTEPPDLDEDTEPVYEGSPLVAIPSFASILAAALAAAKAAATALEAIAAIADALSAIGKLLDRLKEFLDGEEKPESRSIFRYDFGSIEEDGFLRLYPFVNLAEFKAEMLDLQFLSIPTYYGKYFGEDSPNFYRFKELGYIAFVSPTYGILSQIPLEFGRCSIPIPEDSIGFFFHLGLEGGIVANVSAFYSTPPIRI